MPSPLRPDLDSSPFVHPGDALDPLPFNEQIRAADGKHDASDIFMHLFADCIPVGGYKGGRRWRAGYNRMVAIAYSVCPRMFNGMTQVQVAGQLGIHVRVFRRILREVEAQLAARAAIACQVRAKRPR